MTGIAIIGQGCMGQTHAAAWRALGQDVAYVCTPHPKGVFDAAPEARVVTGLEIVLRDPAVEIVSVCTPTTTHRELAVAALAAGKHVLLEKPIALDLDDAIAIHEAGAAAEGQLMAAQVVRFFGGHVLLRDDVQAGRLGRVLSARAHRLSQRPTWAKWLHDESRSGGTIVDLAVHDFDQMNLLLGTPVAVTSRQVGPYGPFETSIEYADGGLGQVLTHQDLPEGAPFTAGISVVGVQGIAEYNLSAASATERGVATSGVNEYRLAATGGSHSRQIGDEDPYARQAEYFLDCVRHGKQPTLSDSASAVRALEVALAARESSHTGRRVAVESRISDGGSPAAR